MIKGGFGKTFNQLTRKGGFKKLLILLVIIVLIYIVGCWIYRKLMNSSFTVVTQQGGGQRFVDLNGFGVIEISASIIEPNGPDLYLGNKNRLQISGKFIEENSTTKKWDDGTYRLKAICNIYNSDNGGAPLYTINKEFPSRFTISTPLEFETISKDANLIAITNVMLKAIVDSTIRFPANIDTLILEDRS